MECLQVKLSRIHNLGLNFKNQRLASRSHSHPSTMSPGIFMNTLWNISAYIIWIVIEDLMSFQGILGHLEACGWAENRHFWRKALRFLLHSPAPDSSVGQSRNSKVLGSEYQNWKCFDSTSERETTPASGAAHSQSPIYTLGLYSAPPAALHHCVTQSTVVHSRVWCLHCLFLQVEGALPLNKSGLKTFILGPLVCHWALQEKLRSFAEMLNIPEQIESQTSSLVSAVQGHESPLWDSHWAFCLVHWVTIGLSYKKITLLW